MKRDSISRSELARGDIKLVRCGFDAEIIKGDGEPTSDNEPIVFAISTGDRDRARDTINVNGWKLKNYMKNPVVLWAHDKNLPPIGKATSVWVENEKLMARMQPTPADMPHPLGHGFGHTIGRMFREGFLHAVSVGFGPETWVFNEQAGGIDFDTQELLEFSPVPIPMNPEALQEADRKGFDTEPIYRWCEMALDTGECLVVPRQKVEEAHAVLKGMHGQARGKKIDVDVDEAVGLVETIKRWVTPRAEPAIDQEDIAMQTKQFEELVGKIDKLASDVEKLKAAPAPAVEPEPEQTVSQEDLEREVADALGSNEVTSLIQSLTQKAVEKSLRTQRGELD
jgi:hypothetical protein